jgi:hypothetical protein
MFTNSRDLACSSGEIKTLVNVCPRHKTSTAAQLRGKTKVMRCKHRVKQNTVHARSDVFNISRSKAYGVVGYNASLARWKPTDVLEETLLFIFKNCSVFVYFRVNINFVLFTG